MANNINKVWELMGINPETGTGTYKNRMGLGNAITRDNGIPLDLSSLHATYNDAVVYAATNAIAYVDQVIAAEGVVYIITAESQGKVTIGDYKDSITGKIIEQEAKEYDVYLIKLLSKKQKNMMYTSSQLELFQVLMRLRMAHFHKFKLVKMVSVL